MSTVDFGALPPEINSGRMYAGAGSGPLLAAAAAWDGVASELSTAASSYRSTVLELAGGPWLGPSSRSMAAAVTPYVAWMDATASQAEQTANQARAAAAAYEAAFIAHVPPPLIAANRALLMSLVATNILGQNTPAIAATETQYAEMWAQDAAAMYGYAGASAQATTLTPFTSPAQDTNPSGTGAQAAAVASATGTSTGTAQNTLSAALFTQATGMLQSLASGAPTNPMAMAVSILSNPAGQALETLVGNLGSDSVYMFGPLVNGGILLTLFQPLLMAIGTAAPAAEAAAPPAAAASLTTTVSAVPGGALGGSTGATMVADMGRAPAVGGLSVPPSWGTASPAIRLAATALPIAGLDGAPEAGRAEPGWFGGLPPVGGMVNAPRYGEAGSRSGSRLTVIPQPAKESAGDESMPSRRANAPDSDGTLSERDELNGLRRAIAEVAKERDVLMRSASLLIKEAITR
jgi:PPE-repeat protein